MATLKRKRLYLYFLIAIVCAFITWSLLPILLEVREVIILNPTSLQSSHQDTFKAIISKDGFHDSFRLNKLYNGTYQSSYLLALGYSEQLSAATHSILQLGTLAYDFGANLVEPTIKSSHVFGIEGVYPLLMFAKNLDSEEVHLFDVYNSSEVNKVLHSTISPTVNMVPFQSFLSNAPRKITLLHFNTRSWDKTARLFALSQDEVGAIEEAFKGYPEEQLFDCLSQNMTVMNKYINRIEKQLNSWGKGDFSVVQALCLNQEYVYKSVYLSQYLSFPSTVIFTNWGGCVLHNCSYVTKEKVLKPNGVKTGLSQPKYAILTEKDFKFNVYNEYKLHHHRVHSIAKDYLRQNNFTQSNFIAVHIRMERIIRQALKSRVQEYQIRCLINLMSAVNRILYGNDTKPQSFRSFRGSQQVLVMSDMPGSEYGSDTCSGRYCGEGDIRKLFSALNTSFSFHHFQPTSGIWNSGLVSLVEMHMLSMGRKLVVTGFGGFQAILKALFLSQEGHAVGDIYEVTC